MSKWYGLIVAIVFAVAALWFPYANDMWANGHYQYFPLLIVAVAALAWSRRYSIASRATASSHSLVVGGLAIFGIASAFGNLLASGLIGILATIFGVMMMVYAAYGRGGLAAAMPVLWLLVFAVPLPLSLDQTLILEMQFFASSLASALLDGLGHLHFREGVILITEKSQFLTEEACSGIRSLFSSMAVVSVYGVVLRHAWYRIVFNLVQTVFWVLVGNSVRVAAVVLLADNVDPWFATGTGHEALGLCVFLFILGMVISTDAVMSLLFYGISIESDEPTEGESALQATGLEVPLFPLPTAANLLLTIGLGLVALLGARVAFVNRGDYLPLQISQIADLPPPAEQDMPPVLGGWQRLSFEHQLREGTSLQAKNSYVWLYRNGLVNAVISVDCPWAEWHNLATCYSALGWELDANYFVENTEVSAEGAKPKTQSELTMQRTEKHGFVVFSVFDRTGTEIFPDWRVALQSWSQLPMAFVQQAAKSLGFGLESQYSLSGVKLPATTIQMLTESSEPLTDDELKELRRFYDVVRERLLAGQRWK